jgi:hypothetical protein
MLPQYYQTINRMNRVMKKILSRFHRLGLLIIALGGLLYAGCNTVPRVASPEAGYLVARYWVEVKGHSDQVRAMNSCAQTIANAKLQTLTRGDNLPALRRYLQALQTPIVVNSAALNSESQISNSRRRAVAEWLAADPQHSAFAGEKASPEWHQALEQTSRVIGQLNAQFDTALAQARQDGTAGRFETAAQAIQTALRLDPENKEAQTTSHDIYRNWTAAKYQKLQAAAGEIRSDVAAQTQNYESDRFTVAVINDCESRLNQAQIQIDAFRAWCAANIDSQLVLTEKMADLRQTETQLADLRGTDWSQKIWLSCHLHHYWDGYQQFLADTDTRELDLGRQSKHSLADYELSVIHARLRAAYEHMLPEGLEFYIRNAAAAAEGQGANGLSLVLCRMAQELLEFGQAQNMKLAPEVESLRAKLDQELNRAESALKTSLARQLIVRDFQSRGDLGQVLAEQIYGEWLKRYAAAASDEKPVPFWMLEIKREAEKTNAYDYVLSGSVKQCYADTLPAKELNVERLEIGQEPKPIPNPDPKQAKKTPTIFEQQLWIYERRTNQFAKKAVIRADTSVAFEGKVVPAASINQEFDDTRATLPGIKLLDLSVENHPIGLEHIQNANASALIVGKLPSNHTADLSSDREIEAALINYARDQVLTNLEVFTALFPLNTLLQDAVSDTDNPIKASEWYGECVEYCSQLATLDQKLAARTGKDWIAWRQATAERIAALKKEQWAHADPALAAKVDHIWELAVASAINAADQMSHSE